MASGFILANQRGIAVSMDTMEINSGGEEYRGINRLFPLGGKHKVVAVSTGLDKFMNIPVELLIRQFAHRLGDQPLAKLTDYSTAFLKFLNSPESGLGEDWYINNIVNLVLDSLYDQFMSLQQKAGNQPQFEPLLNQAVQLVQSRWQASRQNVVISPLDRQQFIDQYNQKLTKVINGWVKQCASYGPTTNGGVFAKQLLMPSQSAGEGERSIFSSIYPQLFEVIRTIMTTDIQQNYASIYFVGMGSQEAFGSCQLMNLYGYLGQLLSQVSRVQSIDQDHSQMIDAVSTYTRQSVGAQLLQQGMAEVSFQQISRILTNHGMSDDDQQRVLGTVRQAMNDHTAGIRKIIVNLSPAELARMSRTMVEANSFVSRYSLRNAGVGGEIEILTITYDQGPVWVRKQHQEGGSANDR